MKAIILAAGEGKRLKPYTDSRPKCMVPLAGRPLLHWQLDVLRSAGIKDIVIVGGYRAEALKACGASVVTNPRYDSTNMVGTLFCARAHMTPGEDLLISYGDIVYEPRVLQAAADCEAQVCITADRAWRRYWEARMDDPLSDVESFRTDSDGRILELGKRPQSLEEVQAQYMGLVKVRGDSVADFAMAYDGMDPDACYDGKDFENMYMTSFVQHLIDTGWDVRACYVDNGWLEVDTVRDLEIYETMARRDELAEFCRLECN